MYVLTRANRSMCTWTNLHTSVNAYMYVSFETIHPLVQEISYTQNYDLENGVKVTLNFICLKSVIRYIHSMNERYIHSLMNIHPFVQEIFHF